MAEVDEIADWTPITIYEPIPVSLFFNIGFVPNRLARTDVSQVNYKPYEKSSLKSQS